MRNLMPGDVLGGYRIEQVLGRGGMGVVYEAIQLSLERRVALKILSGDHGADPQFRRRFQHEALIQASLSHPNIVTVHDSGEIEGMPYIVMRLIRGPTLKVLFSPGPMAPPKLLKLMRQVAEALDAAHAQQLVHRDVKPQNILVRNETKAYLADFGLTRLLTESGFTSSGQFVGTVRYIAPEQIIGLEPTAAADIYSLAAVMYEGLTGSAPYERRTDVAILYAHTNDPIPKATSVAADLPSAIDRVLHRGLAKDPRDRPRTAVALVDDAEHALRG